MNDIPHQTAVIFVNGPPRSGKDTATSALKDLYNLSGPEAERAIRDGSMQPGARHCIAPKMSQPLKDAIMTLFGFTSARMAMIETMKDKPSDFLMGRTYRQVQISLSEHFMKPLFGKGIFGKLLLARIMPRLRSDAPPELVVISDSGFAEECTPIMQHVEPENCLLLHLQREGCTYERDSRSYIDLPVTTVQLNNDGTKEAFEKRVVAVVTSFLDNEE